MIKSQPLDFQEQPQLEIYLEEDLKNLLRICFTPRESTCVIKLKEFLRNQDIVYSNSSPFLMMNSFLEEGRREVSDKKLE